MVATVLVVVLVTRGLPGLGGATVGGVVEVMTGSTVPSNVVGATVAGGCSTVEAALAGALVNEGETGAIDVVVEDLTNGSFAEI